jgi:regulator of nucleoside diphosphate kinase
MHTETASLARPPIILIEGEADALFGLAWAGRFRSSMASSLLLEELSRADTCELAHIPADVVTMGASVVFFDEESGEEHAVQLVYPRDADMAENRVSVLTPIGAALIGLSRGSTIEWPNRLGTHRRLRIVDVIQPSRDA